MDQNPDVIRHEIEETRSALTEKLETLENEVFGTVREAKEAVSSTVENVKEKVQETVQTVKETFDLRRQVCRHPWAAFGGSIAAGYLIGKVLAPERTSINRRRPESSSAIGYDALRNVPAEEPAPPPKQGAGLIGKLLEQFEPELQKVKGITIGVTMGLLRDAIKQRVPGGMSAEFDDLANNVTSKLGGHPVKGPVLETTCRETDFSRGRGSY